MKIKINILKGAIFTLILGIQFSAYSQTYISGNSYFGRNNYIEYIVGDLPLIISVPHGGDLIPDEISDRACGDETVTDLYTVDLAKEIRDAIFEITGCSPHIIINHLKRTKLDANRDMEIGACEDEYAEIAWNEYHKFIDSAKVAVERRSGKGLFIDLHGHGHAIQRLELGYLLSATQLRYSDATLNTTEYENFSSIRNLIYSNVTNLTHSDLLRGIASLGSMLAENGFPGVPSIDDPFPLVGQSYFSGGYNTQRHGSVIAGTIDGIQIECNQDVRFVESVRKDFAANFGGVMLEYLTEHYFPELPQTYCNIVHSEMILSSHFMIYPNPVENRLYIHTQFPAELCIYNFQGRLVFSKSIGTDEEIYVGQLRKGIYFVKLQKDGTIVYRQKIVKAYE